jgi:hypothetical protein
MNKLRKILTIRSSPSPELLESCYCLGGKKSKTVSRQVRKYGIGLLLFASLVSSQATESVSFYQNVYDAEFESHQATFDSMANSNWGNTYYSFQAAFAATLSLYEATQDPKYLQRALTWGQTMVSDAKITDYGGYKNWAGIWASTYAALPIAYMLEDLQGSTELARLARIVLTSPTLKSTYGSEATVIYNFVRTHILNKHLFSRGGLWWFKNNVRRTDAPMSDKTALVLRILVDIKLSSAALGGADNGTYGYPAVVADLANGFEDHVDVDERFEDYQGGSIWDKGMSLIGSYSAIDTEHANRFPWALIDLYRAGIVFSEDDVLGLADLLNEVIWNQSLTNPMFRNFIDGSNGSFLNREAWRNGMIYSGWVQLAQFDPETFTIADAALKAILAGNINASLSYNASPQGIMALAGHLAKAAALSGTLPPRGEPPPDPAPSPSSGQVVSFVTGKVLGTLRNGYTGWVGMKFTVGTSPLTVTSLGRTFASGNSRSHIVKLVKASDGTDVSNGSVSISMAAGTVGQVKYAPLASLVTLSANTSYYLVSQENYNGDQWYDCDSGVTTTSVAACNGFVYSWEPWNVYLYPGRTYGPLDFKYLE